MRSAIKIGRQVNHRNSMSEKANHPESTWRRGQIVEGLEVNQLWSFSQFKQDIVVEEKRPRRRMALKAIQIARSFPKA